MTTLSPIVVRYPIPDNECGGLLHIYGEPTTAKNVILYCGGWPDGVEPFTPMAICLAAIRTKTTCTSTATTTSTTTTNTSHSTSDTCAKEQQSSGSFIGITCWPGFDAETFQSLKKYRGFKRQGYTFHQVSCCIREAAKQLFAQYYSQKQQSPNETAAGKDDVQFTVIFHDFGVLPGLMFVNQSIEEHDDNNYFTPDRIVLLDVLLEPHGGSFQTYASLTNISPYTLRELFVYTAYRGMFACAFAMLRYFSEAVGLFTFQIMYMLVILLQLAPLDPRGNDVSLLRKRKMDPYHMVYTFYPYYHLFYALLFHKHELLHGCLPFDLKKTPILYLYGEEKNVMFHDHRSLALLQEEERERRSDCRVVKVKGAGHWMYCQKPEECELEIRKFLNMM